jgi:hypothetical protein
VCVRSLLPASEKRVAADEERVGRFAKNQLRRRDASHSEMLHGKRAGKLRALSGMGCRSVGLFAGARNWRSCGPSPEGRRCVCCDHCDGVGQRNDRSRRREPSWFWFSVPGRPFWHEIDVAMPDFRGANRERCVSYVTLRWLSKKCTCAGLNCGPRRASR